MLGPSSVTPSKHIFQGLCDWLSGKVQGCRSKLYHMASPDYKFQAVVSSVTLRLVSLLRSTYTYCMQPMVFCRIAMLHVLTYVAMLQLC